MKNNTCGNCHFEDQLECNLEPRAIVVLDKEVFEKQIVFRRPIVTLTDLSCRHWVERRREEE